MSTSRPCAPSRTSVTVAAGSGVRSAITFPSKASFQYLGCEYVNELNDRDRGADCEFSLFGVQPAITSPCTRSGCRSESSCGSERWAWVGNGALHLRRCGGQTSGELRHAAAWLLARTAPAAVRLPRRT